MDDKEYLAKLKQFFETRSICIEAAKPLKKGAAVEIKNPVSGKSYTFEKTSAGAVISEGAPRDCELFFSIPPKGLDYIVDFDTNDIGRYAIRIFEAIISKDPEVKVSLKVRAGILTIVLKGYLGVIMLGGKTMMGWLSQHGIGGIDKIKDILSKLREK